MRVRGGRTLARPGEEGGRTGRDALGHLVLHLADALPRELVALAPDLLAVGDALDASREATAPSGPLEGAADRVLGIPRAGRTARLAHRAPVDHAQPGRPESRSETAWLMPSPKPDSLPSALRSAKQVTTSLGMPMCPARSGSFARKRGT